MKHFSFANHLNKVWMLALVAFMVACSQFEAQGPDDVTLESGDELTLLERLNSGFTNFAIIPSSPTSDGGVVPGILDPDGPGGNVTCEMIAMEYEVSFGNGTTDNINYNDGAFDADFPEGFTVTTDGTLVTWSYNKPGYCLVNAAIAVKGGNAANVYVYTAGETGDSGLASPPNASGGPAGLSNLTICWTEVPCVDECWDDETAWAAGSRYVARGNWATFTSRDALKDGNVTLFAGQTMVAGVVNSAGSDDGIEITITLNTGWRFALVDEPVKVQDYDSAPSGNPSPGLFAWKDAVINGNTATLIVPINNFYGIHVDVERSVPCEVE